MDAAIAGVDAMVNSSRWDPSNGMVMEARSTITAAIVRKISRKASSAWRARGRIECGNRFCCERFETHEPIERILERSGGAMGVLRAGDQQLAGMKNISAITDRVEKLTAAILRPLEKEWRPR